MRDIEEYVKAMRLKGVKGLHYIRRALVKMSWILSLESIRDYLASVLSENGLNVAKHTSANLKSFLKQMLKLRIPGLFSLLCNSYTTIKVKPNNCVRLPTIEELRQILQHIESVEAKAYFLILVRISYAIVPDPQY